MNGAQNAESVAVPMPDWADDMCAVRTADLTLFLDWFDSARHEPLPLDVIHTAQRWRLLTGDGR